MQRKNIIVIFLITLVGVMGVASITPAFPSTIKHFGITPTQVTLLITVFTFPGIFLAPVIGVLADNFGRKTILIPSLISFWHCRIGMFFYQRLACIVNTSFFPGNWSCVIGNVKCNLNRRSL